MSFKLINLLKGLKNIFLCSFYSIVGRLKYPAIILPKSSFYNPIDFEKLLSEVNVVFTRRIDVGINDIHNEVGVIKTSLFKRKDVPGMSLNILGKHFKSKFNKFKTQKEGSEYWEGQPIYLSNHINHFTEVDINFSNLYLSSSDLHHVPVPFYRPNDRESIKLYESLGIQPVIDGSRLMAEGEIFLEHKPTNLNYWHAELSFNSIDGTPINRNKLTPIQKEAADHVIEHILTGTATIDEPLPIPAIPSRHFKKQ